MALWVQLLLADVRFMHSLMKEINLKKNQPRKPRRKPENIVRVSTRKISYLKEKSKRKVIKEEI
jgi:hypothetical protein